MHAQKISHSKKYCFHLESHKLAYIGWNNEGKEKNKGEN